MNLIAALTSLIFLAASPPPPPPPAPEVAQGEFDGFAGPDLWRVWQNTVRVRALALKSESYAQARELGDGHFVRREGPRAEVSTGWWNEGFDAEYAEICPRNRYDQCDWVYRSVRLVGQLDDFNAIAESTFDGDSIAAALRAAGETPGSLTARDTHLQGSEALDSALTAHVQMIQRSARNCPAVGQWQERLRDVAPIRLSGFEADASSPPPSPYPIHIRHVIEIPSTAFGTADVILRIEDTRNAQLGELWSRMTQGIAECESGL